VAKLTAVVTTYNRADFIAICVRSIFAVASESMHVRVVVMDNGSVDETPQVLADFQSKVPEHGVLEIQRTEDNRPIVGVLNRGLGHAREQETDYLVVMNDDTEYTPGSLQRLIDACDAQPASLLTPVQINYRAQDHIDANALGHLQQVGALVEDATLGRPLQDVYDLPTIIGACILARADVWDNLGDFDSIFRGASVARRAGAADLLKNSWGDRFIVLPNPMYGDWEGAVYDGNWKLSPEEKSEARKDALDTWNM